MKKCKVFAFLLCINRCLIIECLLKKCITEQLLCGLFFERLSWTEGIHANLSREKSFLFCVNKQICLRFRKFSKQQKLEWNFISFTFASQWKLFEFLSYGEHNLIELPFHVNMSWWASGLKLFWMKQFFIVAVLTFFVTSENFWYVSS